MQLYIECKRQSDQERGCVGGVPKAVTEKKTDNCGPNMHRSVAVAAPTGKDPQAIPVGQRVGLRPKAATCPARRRLGVAARAQRLLLLHL